MSAQVTAFKLGGRQQSLDLARSDAVVHFRRSRP
ncbi:hypothetical protein RA210_U250038 [Rubrivivax sp. A210]|nr:hypothetical protein RA210_U250038 [Rubrivivax sp. A210]